ncbi:MAG: hypothetical protein R2708_25290 [Vicinamibacterales bacterium]
MALSAFYFAFHAGAAVRLPLRTAVLAVFFGAVIHAAAHHDGLHLLKATLRLGWLRHASAATATASTSSTASSPTACTALAPRVLPPADAGAHAQLGADGDLGVAVSYAVALASYSRLRSAVPVAEVALLELSGAPARA